MPSFQDTKRIIQQIINRYDAQKGLRRKFSLFKESYSPFMQDLLIWQRTGESLDDLKKILIQHYRVYFSVGNFIYSRSSKDGVDLSFQCLVDCDNRVFDGAVCSKILSPEIDNIPRSIFEKNIIHVLTQKGLLHYLPHKFLEALKETSFFINYYSGDRNTPLAWAIANGGFETAKTLIALAPLEALMIQDRWGGKSILSLLVAKGSDYTPDTSDSMIKEGSVKAVFDTLMSREDLTPNLINQQDYNGNTPLHIAFLRRDRHMIAVLVEKGANIGITNNSGLTPVQLYESMTAKNAYKYISQVHFGSKAKLGFLHDSLARRVPDDDLSDLIQKYSKTLGAGF